MQRIEKSESLIFLSSMLFDNNTQIVILKYLQVRQNKDSVSVIVLKLTTRKSAKYNVNDQKERIYDNSDI